MEIRCIEKKKKKTSANHSISSKSRVTSTSKSTWNVVTKSIWWTIISFSLSQAFIQIFNLFSFSSWIFFFFFFFFFGNKSKYLPVQISPLPKNPALQVHVKLPIVFVHFASIWQLCVFDVHSLISAKKKKRIH